MNLKNLIFFLILNYRSAVGANATYLEQQAKENPDRLAKKNPNGPEILGAVYIHPSAQIDPTAKVIK